MKYHEISSTFIEFLMEFALTEWNEEPDGLLHGPDHSRHGERDGREVRGAAWMALSKEEKSFLTYLYIHNIYIYVLL